MGQFGIGQPIRRKEDVRLVTGKGRYSDDIQLDNQLHIHFFRSPHSHAEIVSIDLEAAREAPGVHHIFVHEDLAADGVQDLVTEVDFSDRDGTKIRKSKRPVLARGRVRFVGEPVLMIIAETREQARAAGDLIQIEWEELPAVASSVRALEEDASVVWPEFGSNLGLHWELNDKDEIDGIIANSAKSVTIDIVNNRLIPNPMEPRVALAEYDAETDRITLYAPTQGVRGPQAGVSRMLGIKKEKLRVISPDTGGGFGIRGKLYLELVAVAWAAKKIGRAVKWLSTRSETFVSDYHGRDQVNHAVMGFDENGRITALHAETILNVGAYMGENGPRLPIDGGGRIIPCSYDIEKFYFSVKTVYTNTVTTDTYRGAGRPEANFLMERLMDLGAEACGLSRDEIRRRNFIAPDSMPYRTQMGLLIDSGDFAGNLDMALKEADQAGFAARRKESEARGKLRGFGIGSFVEQSGGRPVEEMRVRIAADGSASIFAGTFSHGQGHDTAYAQILHDHLNLDLDQVSLIQGDTDTTPAQGVGTFGSRSSMMGGVGIKRTAEQIVVKAKKIAGHLLQSDEGQVEFEEGVFHAGAASITFVEVAKAAHDPARLPEGMAPGLDENWVYNRHADHFNFPNGCHICELEIDPDLGTIEILRYTAVDDCGTVLNPMLVHGQVFGGVAQGLGQALVENTVYEEGTAQFLSGSFVDYGMPRAHHMSHMDAYFNVVPCKTNELGVKGAGEAGACAAPSAIVGAVVDALKPYGISHIDMPVTPEKIWRVIAGQAA